MTVDLSAPEFAATTDGMASPSHRIVRLSPEHGPPGDPWGFLAPERYQRRCDDGTMRDSGIWTAKCPLGCGRRVEIWQIDDGSACPPWVLAGPCYGGCDPADMAERLSAATGLPRIDFMPPLIVTDDLLEAIAGMVERHGGIGAAWRGEGNFRSNWSRVACLGHRMEEAGATWQMVVLAQMALSQQIGP